MNKSRLMGLLAAGALSTALVSSADSNVRAWGNNVYGQISVPGDLTNAVGLGGGDHHATALRADGTVSAWGGNGFGETNVPTGLAQVVSARANMHNNMALRANGSVEVWGQNSQVLLAVPAGLSNVAAVGPGVLHDLVLFNNGTVAAWGTNTSGECTVPDGLSNVVAVSAGFGFSLALRSDGRMAAWGENAYGQCSVPTGLSNVVAIAAGGSHALALKAEGTVAAWGHSELGQLAIPAGLSNVIAIAANGNHNLALRDDGSVVAWGYIFNGQASVPAGLSNVTGIAAGQNYSMALLGVGKPVVTPAGSSLEVPAGSTFFLRAEAVGLWPLRYQWRKNGVDIEGADKLVLQSTGPQSGAEEYQCVVSNTLGVSTGTVVRVQVRSVSGPAPVLHYGFNAASTGRVADLSLYGNTGIVHGASCALDDGVAGGSFSFDGIDDFVDAGRSASLQMTSNFTLSAWIKPAALPGAQGIIMKSKGYPSQDRRAVEFYLEQKGKLVGYFWGGTETFFCGVTAEGVINAGQWAHVVMQHDASLPGHQMRMYVNGAAVPLDFVYETVASVPSVSAVDEPWTIGAWAQGRSAFNGKIDEARIFSGVLSSNEVFDLYEKDRASLVNGIAIVTDRPSVSVPEGGVFSFQAKLSAQPTGETVVVFARSSGDEDIAVSGASNLTFTPSGWDTYQAVTLAAAEDNGDNQNGSASIRCSGPGVDAAVVEATEVDDDFTLAITSRYGTVGRVPDLPFYDSGTDVVLTAFPDGAYYVKGYSGDLIVSNNPASISMDGNKSVVAIYGPDAPQVLPPRMIGRKSFNARWRWVEGGAPEGELSVTLEVEGFPQYVPGYKRRYVVNNAECLVTNLLSGKTYWYRVRGLMPDGTVGVWSDQMKVQTGSGVPAFKNLLSEGPVSKGVSQSFAIPDLMTGDALLKVKSSDTNAVKAGLSAGFLNLQYLWKTNSAATVTLTLTQPGTGYRVAYATTLRRAGGPVVIVANTGLTNAGSVVAQDLTVENRAGHLINGVRIRAFGLDNADWLINKTGSDPVSKAAIREIPCVLPAGSQVVVRLVYNAAYKKQAKTHPAAFGAWAVMNPVSGLDFVNGRMSSLHQGLYDGLWLLGLPANCNRIYSVYHSDDEGSTWVLDTPMIRATTSYLMWLDLDEGAPDHRVYRVMEIGM